MQKSELKSRDKIKTFTRVQIFTCIDIDASFQKEKKKF